MSRRNRHKSEKERRDLEGRLDAFEVRREHGRDLSASMARLLFGDVYACFLELGSNAYDADATHFNIAFNQATDTLTVSDDGEGIGREDAAGFYRLGDSPKKNLARTRKGRKPIGEYGVASLVLRTLGEHYVLESVKDGTLIRVEETFRDGEGDDKPIKVEAIPSNGKSRGTTIDIRNLRFLRDGRGLDLDVLKRKLAIELPISPEFHINVNGVPVKPKEISPTAFEYVLDVNDPLVGHVHGSIYYNRRSLPEEESGIYIKVHGRAVGGSNLDLFGERFSVGLARRVYGVIHAEGLRDIIGFDRSHFLDHPKFNKLSTYVFDILRQMRQDMEEDLRQRGETKTDSRVSAILPAVGTAVGEILGRDKFGIIFSDSVPVSAIDTRVRKLTINPNSHVFGLSSIHPRHVKDVLLRAAEYALANSLITDPEKRAEHERVTIALADKRSRTGKHSLADLVGGESAAETTKPRLRISKNRIYSYVEASRITDYSNAVIKRLVESGVLTDRADRLIGEELLELRKRMSDHLSLYDAIRGAVPNPGRNDFALWQSMERTAISRLDRLVDKGETLPPYISDLSRDGKPSFYIVNVANLDSLKHFIEFGDLPTAAALGHRKFAYVKFKGKGPNASRGGAVVYSLRVLGDMNPEVVRETATATLRFVKDLGEGSIPLGIRTRSYYAAYEGKRFIVGIYTGDKEATDISEVEKAFEANGFDRVNVANGAVSKLYEETSEQRSISQPMTIAERFNDWYLPILEQLVDE